MRFLQERGTVSSGDSLAMTSQGSSKILRKISIAAKQRGFRVAVLGQNGVGKSAMTVRFITRRFIGEYDPLLEKVYCCTKMIDGESVLFEVLDTAAQEEHSRIEENIKWADAFVLLYSVTDRCSLNECCRLKFLINSYNKRHRKANLSLPDVAPAYSPVVLVGNQIDRCYDRMVTAEEGQEKARELGCVGFYEISVRECVECVQRIFADLYYCYRRPKKQRAAYKAASLAMMRAASLSMDDSLDMIGTRQEVPHSKRRGALHTIS